MCTILWRVDCKKKIRRWHISGKVKNETNASSIIPLVEWMNRSHHLSEKISIHQGRLLVSVLSSTYCGCFFFPTTKSHVRHITFLVPADTLTKDSHNSGNVMPYSPLINTIEAKLQNLFAFQWIRKNLHSIPTHCHIGETTVARCCGVFCNCSSVDAKFTFQISAVYDIQGAF